MIQLEVRQSQFGWCWRRPRQTSGRWYKTRRGAWIAGVCSFWLPIGLVALYLSMCGLFALELAGVFS